MSRAIFTFTDQLTNQTADKIEFDLIDNVGCRAWQYAVMLNDCSRTLFRTGPVKFHKSLPYDIEIKYKKLKQVVDKLDSWSDPGSTCNEYNSFWCSLKHGC